MTKNTQVNIIYERYTDTLNLTEKNTHEFASLQTIFIGPCAEHPVHTTYTLQWVNKHLRPTGPGLTVWLVYKSDRYTFALQALLDESVEERAAVVAEGEPLVGVHHEAVRHVHVEALPAGHAHAALLLRGEERGDEHVFF